ncbi:MAG: acetate uptake transporter [Proteobacteria bacterium]|nr:acetate uptake transporter [Pseudomonadota bacterium]
MNRIANAAGLGYAAFALSLWMTSMIPAGWFDSPDAILPRLMALVLGGCVMAIAGIAQGLRGHALDATLFVGFAAFWWVGGLPTHLAGAGSPPLSHGMLGWYYIVWALFAFCIWLAACRDGVARMLFALGLCLSLLSLALAEWLHLDALTVLGGYLGLVAAIVGIYVAAAEMINQSSGHSVLPLGESTQDAPSSPR